MKNFRGVKPSNLDSILTENKVDAIWSAWALTSAYAVYIVV